MSAGPRTGAGAPGRRGAEGAVPAHERGRGVLLVHDPRMASFELDGGHPFKPVRMELTRSLLAHAGLLAASEVVAPTPIGDADLLTVHDEAYVAAVRSLSAGGPREGAGQLGLGTADNPVFAGMHELVSLVCAGTVTAMDAVATGRALRAVNLGGGLHHAMRDRASGFCVYNDLAVAIRRAVDRHGMRVAYVDLDAHHGDGVQWLFYEDPDVLTVSLHESGHYLFPGTGHTYETGKGAGRGLSVNVPLEPFTEDESYLAAFEVVVPEALRRFAPDVIVLQAGADPHRHDPLADLSLTLSGMRAAYERVVQLADELTGGRIVATGGGGYDPYRTVPRAWAHLWSAVTGRALPAELPEPWRAEWEPRLGVELPRRSSDGPEDFPPQPKRAQVARRNQVVAWRVRDALDAIWRDTGLKGRVTSRS